MFHEIYLRCHYSTKFIFVLSDPLPPPYCSHPVQEVIGQHAGVVLVPEPLGARRPCSLGPCGAGGAGASAGISYRQDAGHLVLLSIVLGLLVHGGECLVAVFFFFKQ